MESLMLPRSNIMYSPRLRSLPTLSNNQSRLDPNTQMRVITDPLLNMSYRRQFEDYQQNIFTEYLGRVEGTAIGAIGGTGIGTVVGTIIGSIASIFVPGDFGTLAVAGAKIGAEVGAITGGAAGFVHADYTTHHATMDTINNTIIASFKQNPAMGVLNSLAFTGKSMDLIMGGEAIRATISAAITGNNMFENITRAYGTHENGRTEYDFSVLREQMGLDLGAFGNFVFDMAGEIITDPGAWGGITGKLLTRGKAGKAVVESLDGVNSSMKVITKQAMEDPKLMKQLARSFRHGNKDEILSVMKSMVDKRKTKAINEEVLSKFISNVQESATKSTAFNLYKMFQTLDETDDLLTAQIFKIANPPLAAWHGLKKSKQLLNEKWLYNLAPDNKAVKIISDIMDFILGNKAKQNFINEGINSARRYISAKYNQKQSFFKEGTLHYFIYNKLDSPAISLYKKYLKEGNDINDPAFKNIKEQYIKYRDEVLSSIENQTQKNSERLIEINSEVTGIDKKIERLMKGKRFRNQLSLEKREEYKKLYDQRKKLSNEFKEIAKQEKNAVWQKRAINRTAKDKEFNKVLWDLQKLAALTRGQIPGEEKRVKELLSKLVKLVNESEGEQYLDEIMYAYRNQPTFLDFLRKNIDDDIVKELKVNFSTKQMKYTQELQKVSPKYRKSILLEEITNIDRLKTKNNEAEFNKLKKDIEEVTSSFLKNNPNKEIHELYEDSDFFNKVINRLNDFKNKYLYDSIKDNEFLLKSDYAKQLEETMNKQVDELNKLAKFNNIFTNYKSDISFKNLKEFEYKSTSKFGVYYVKAQNRTDILTEQFRETFSKIVSSINEIDFVENSHGNIKEAVGLLNSVIGSFVKIDSGISNTYRNLINIRKRLGNVKTDKQLNQIKQLINMQFKDKAISNIPDNIFFNRENVSNLIKELKSFQKFDKKRSEIYDSIISELSELKVSNNKEVSIFDQIDPIIFRSDNFESLDDMKQYALKTIKSDFHPMIKSNFDAAEDMIKTARLMSKNQIIDSKLKTDFIKFLDEFESFIKKNKSVKADKWSGKKVYSFINELNSQLEKFQTMQTNFAISSMKFELHFVRKTYDDLINKELKNSIKLRNNIIKEFLSFGDASVNLFEIKNISKDNIVDLMKNYQGEEFIKKLSELLNIDEELVLNLGVTTKYLESFNNHKELSDLLAHISSNESDLKKLSNIIAENKNISIEQLGWGVVDDILAYSNSSVKNIIKNMTDPNVAVPAVLNEIFNFFTRKNIILKIFEQSDNKMLSKIVSRIGELENLFKNLLDKKVTDLDKFKNEVLDRISVIDDIRNFAYKDMTIKNKFGLNLKIKFKDGKFSYDTSKYSTEYKEFIRSLEQKIDRRDLKLHELINYSDDYISKIIRDNISLDPDNIKQISSLYEKGNLKLNQFIEDVVYSEDYTKELTRNNIVKHIRSSTQSNKDFANKTISQFRYIVVDTETMNEYGGLLSLSYRVFSYKDGKLISGEKIVMYIDPKDIKKNIEVSQEVEEMNAKILNSKGQKRNFTRGATRQLHKLNIDEAGRSYKKSEVLDTLNKVINEDPDNTFVVMHNAPFDMKQIFNAKYELDNKGQSLFNNKDAFELNNDFNSLFKQSGYDWNVIDSLDLVDKYGLINTNDLTNLGLGKSSINIKVEKQYIVNGVVKKSEITGDPNSEYTIKITYDTSKEDPEILFNNRSLHDAEVDTELTEAWLGNIFNKIQNTSIGEFTDSIYTETKYVDEIMDIERIYKGRDYPYQFKKMIRDFKNREMIPYDNLSKKQKMRLEEILDKAGIDIDFNNTSIEEIKGLPGEALDILGFPNEEVYMFLDGNIPTTKQVKMTYTERFKKVIEEYLNLSNRDQLSLNDSSDYGLKFNEAFSEIFKNNKFETKDDIRLIIPRLQELIDRYRKNIIYESQETLTSDSIQPKYFSKTEVPKELQALEDLLDEYDLLLKEANAQKTLNYAMTKQKNIAYRQVNTALVNSQLVNSFKYNISFMELRDIIAGKIKPNDTTSKRTLAKLFDSNSNDPLVKKFNSLPQIKKLKETFNDIDDNIRWFESLSNDLSNLGVNYQAHYSVVCQLLNSVDRIIKDKVAGSGLNVIKWSDTDIEEVIGSVRSHMQRLQDMYRNTTDMTFGKSQKIYDKIIKRCTDMLAKGKLPYMQPSSKFTNDFYNQLNEVFLNPLKDVEGNIFFDLDGGVHYTDSVNYLQSLMSNAVGPIRQILAETKNKNKLYRTNPINIRGISSKMVINLSDDLGLRKALRPVELPLYSKTTLVYSNATKPLIDKRSTVNQIFAHFFKDLEIFDGRTLPITTFESNKLSQTISRIADAVGYSEDYIINNLKISNIDLDEPLSELKKSLFEKIYAGDFEGILDAGLLKVMGEDRLTKLQSIAAEILFINKDSYKSIDPNKISQLKNVFATLVLDNLLFKKEIMNPPKLTAAGYKYNKALVEVDATKQVWKQIQQFFTNGNGEINVNGIRNYFNTNRHETLVYIDPTNGFLKKLNTDNINLLNNILKRGDSIDISVMSEDSYLRYVGKNQRREFKNPVLKFMRDAVLRNIKLVSLTFSLPFIVTNALAAAVQDITSSEGTINIISFTKNFTKAINEYKLWKQPYEVIGSSYLSYFYRTNNRNQYVDWADYFESKDFREFIETLSENPGAFEGILLKNKNKDAIQKEAQAILSLLNQYKDTDISKIKEFNKYMRTASVSGQSAEFNNRQRIIDSQKENLEYLKEIHANNTDDMRYFIYNIKANDGQAIKAMGYEGEIPKFKDIKDEYNWLSKQKYLSDDLNHRKNQLGEMIDDANKEFYTSWLDKTKLPKMFLDFNGDIETVFRTTMLKTLIDEGASLDEAAAEVIRRHFLYTDKSLGEQMAEFIIPFISYPLRSLNLFDELTYDSSFMKMAYLWDKYSWGDAEEQRKKSDYLTSRKAKGDLPIGNVLLKGTNPFTESMMLVADPVGSFKNKLNPVIRTATGIPPVTQLPGVSLANNLVQGLQDMSTGNYTPGQITGLANSFYRNSQYFYNKRPYAPKVKPFYNNLYTSGGFSRIAMNMQPTTLKNVQYRVGSILYKRSIM